jgi:outer membrane protein assembly factor BamB
MIPSARRRYAAWQLQRFNEACAEVRAVGGDAFSPDPAAPGSRPAVLKAVVLYSDFGPVDAQTAVHLRPYLQRFPDFEFDLQGRKFEAGALSQWAGLRNIRMLTASALTDGDLPTIAQFPKLEAVALSGKQITDRGLLALKGLPNLRCIVAARTSVTTLAAAQIEAASPRVAVFFPSVDLATESRPPPFEAAQIEDESNVLHSFLVHRDDDGKQLWSTPFPGEPYDRTLWNEQRVFQPQSDGIHAYDANTGKWVWRLPNVPNQAYSTAGDLLFIYHRASPQPDQPRPAEQLMAVTASDGKLLFETQAPSGDNLSGDPLVLGGVIFLPVLSGAHGIDDTLALDRSGRLLFRLHGHVVAVVPEASGWTCLMPGDVRHVRADGSIAWTVPTHWGGTAGQIIRCPNSDLIAFTYNQAGESYSAIRLNAFSGVAKWHYVTPPHVSNHFIYTLEVHAELRRGLLAFTQDGTEGMHMMVLDAASGQPVLVIENIPAEKPAANP